MAKTYTLSGDRMFPDENGRWVHREEYDALAARLAEAERYISALEEHMDGYGLDAAQRSMSASDSADAVPTAELILAWMQAPNPRLGGVTPLWMMENQRGERLAAYIHQAIWENSPPPNMVPAPEGSRVLVVEDTQDSTMHKYWIPGPISNYGTTDTGFCGEVRVVLASDYDALAARLAEAVGCLRELAAQVRGECPSLLNEDSGGDARLSMQIDDVLAAVSAPAAHGPEWDATRRQQGYIDRSDEIERQLTGSADEVQK